jgi:hypothetical protein
MKKTIPWCVKQKLANDYQKEVISRCVVLIFWVISGMSMQGDTVYYKDYDLVVKSGDLLLDSISTNKVPQRIQ